MQFTLSVSPCLEPYGDTATEIGIEIVNSFMLGSFI